jgi:hypothetical protein
VNDTVTARAALITTVHVVPLVPAHAPPHPPNALPLAAVAVSVTEAPDAYEALQPVAPAAPLVMEQLMPVGVEVTVPLPVPAPVIVSAKFVAVMTSATEIVVGLFSATDEVTEIVAPYVPAARLPTVGCTDNDAGAVVELRFVVNQPVAPAPYCTETASPLSVPPPEFVMLTDCCGGLAPAPVVKVKLAGATAMRGRAVTVTVTCFDAAPEVAVISAVPADMPVTTPAPSTAATFEALDVHVTGLALSTVPLALFGVAVIVAVCPTFNETEGGLTSMVATATGSSLVVEFEHAAIATTANEATRLGHMRRGRREVNMIPALVSVNSRAHGRSGEWWSLSIPAVAEGVKRATAPRHARVPQRWGEFRRDSRPRWAGT